MHSKNGSFSVIVAGTVTAQQFALTKSDGTVVGQFASLVDPYDSRNGYGVQMLNADPAITPAALFWDYDGVGTDHVVDMISPGGPAGINRGFARVSGGTAAGGGNAILNAQGNPGQAFVSLNAQGSTAVGLLAISTPTRASSFQVSETDGARIDASSPLTVKLGTRQAWLMVGSGFATCSAACAPAAAAFQDVTGATVTLFLNAGDKVEIDATGNYDAPAGTNIVLGVAINGTVQATTPSGGSTASTSRQAGSITIHRENIVGAQGFYTFKLQARLGGSSPAGSSILATHTSIRVQVFASSS